MREFQHYRWWSLFILLSYTILQTSFLIFLPLEHQEGLNLQLSRLITRGYQPYTQIFTLDNPLFVTFLGWLGQFSLSPLGFKFVFLGFSLLFLVAVAVVARFWLGQRVALAALLLLATATTFLAEAGQVVPAIPALSLAMISLTFTCRYLAERRSFWLLLGGVLWGISLFLAKVAFSLSLVHLVFLVFAHRHSRNWPVLLKEMAWWLGGALVVLTAGLFLATPEIIFNHLIRDYQQIRETLAIPQEAHFRLIGQFLAFNLWLFILAAYALAELYQKSDHPLWLVVIWGLINFIWLMVQPVLQATELALLLPPLALLAGWGAVQAGGRLFQKGAALPALGRWGAIFLLLVIYGWVSQQQFRAFLLREVDTASDLTQIERRQEIADFIAQHTQPESCVIIDDAALSVAANRLPAPELTEISELRILSGLLTEPELIKLVQEKECEAVVFSKREYYLHLASFQGLLSAYYPHEDKIIQTRMYYR